MSIDVGAVVARLGPPIRDELAHGVPAERLEDAVDLFRRAFVAGGLARLQSEDGAAELLVLLKERGVTPVVITSRREEIARACLEYCGLDVRAVVGSVTGGEKAEPLRRRGAVAYIGDHPLDMHAARSAGVVAVGVTTGNHGPGELRAAGADLVVDSLRAVGDVVDGIGPARPS